MTFHHFSHRPKFKQYNFIQSDVLISLIFSHNAIHDCDLLYRYSNGNIKVLILINYKTHTQKKRTTAKRAHVNMFGNINTDVVHNPSKKDNIDLQQQTAINLQKVVGETRVSFQQNLIFFFILFLNESFNSDVNKHKNTEQSVGIQSCDAILIQFK